MSHSAPKPASITFNLRNGYLRCEAYTPAHSEAVVVLTHGTGTCRTNRYIRQIVNTFYEQQIALITADVLTDYELSDHRCRLDTELVSQRLIMLVSYLKELPLLSDLPLSLLGIGTGADGALAAAARIPSDIKAVAAINGLNVRPEKIKNILPPAIPVLLVHQETLGQAGLPENGFSHGQGNITVKKIFKSDESIPWEAMDEAAGWLCRLHSGENRKFQSLKVPHEMGSAG
jgi:pimeloyl-ACP methyl ester carboxylesterase